jgi:hypothetical protein
MKDVMYMSCLMPSGSKYEQFAACSRLHLMVGQEKHVPVGVGAEYLYVHPCNPCNVLQILTLPGAASRIPRAMLGLPVVAVL